MNNWDHWHSNQTRFVWPRHDTGSDVSALLIITPAENVFFEAESFVFIIDDADSTEGVAGTIEAVYGVSWLETVGSIATLLDHV